MNEGNAVSLIHMTEKKKTKTTRAPYRHARYRLRHLLTGENKNKRGSSSSDLQKNPETSADLNDNKNSGLTLLSGFSSSSYFLFF